MSNETGWGDHTSAAYENGSGWDTPGNSTIQQPEWGKTEGDDHWPEQEGHQPEQHSDWAEQQGDWPASEQHGDWPTSEQQDDWPAPELENEWTNPEWPDSPRPWVAPASGRYVDILASSKEVDLLNNTPELFTVYEQDMTKPVDLSVIEEARIHLVNAESYSDLERHTTLFAYLDGMGRVCPYLPVELQDSVKVLLELRQDRANYHDKSQSDGQGTHKPAWNVSVDQAVSTAQSPHEATGASSSGNPAHFTISETSSVNEVEARLKELQITSPCQEMPDVADILKPDGAWMCQEDDISKIMAAAHYIYSFKKLGKSLEDEQEAALRNVAKPIALQLLYQGGDLNIEAGKIFLLAFTKRERDEALSKETYYDTLRHTDDDESPGCSDVDSDNDADGTLMITAPLAKGKL